MKDRLGQTIEDGIYLDVKAKPYRISLDTGRPTYITGKYGNDRASKRLIPSLAKQLMRIPNPRDLILKIDQLADI